MDRRIDIIYACQDIAFDQKYGVHSIPRRFGIHAAFWWYRGMHVLTSASLLGLGVWMDLGVLYYVGWAVASVLLVYENSLVKPNDLSKLQLAFFTVNSYIAVVLLLFTSLDVAL